MQKNSLVRTIYLYLFTIIGLVLLTIGSVRLVDMGLKTFIFKKADQEQRLWPKQPPYLSVDVSKVGTVGNDRQIEGKEGEITLSAEEKTRIDQWILDYNSWQEQSSKIDPVSAQRQRDVSTSLSMILIGLPLYLFHWRTIARETKEKDA